MNEKRFSAAVSKNVLNFEIVYTKIFHRRVRCEHILKQKLTLRRQVFEYAGLIVKGRTKSTLRRVEYDKKCIILRIRSVKREFFHDLVCL